MTSPSETGHATSQQQQEVNPQITTLGGYDCEFLTPIPQELQTACPICLLVLREPFQVTCCGYSFCRPCIERILSDKKTCPTCNVANFSNFPNKGLHRSLCSFRVRCVHHKCGCEWTGELRELDEHLNLNPEAGKQLIGCKFVAVTCTHCCKCFQRCDMRIHENESCAKRPFTCNYCEDYGSVYEDVVSNHWPVCKWYPVPCPNECGVISKRQDVETHVNTECPLTVVNCDFYYAGCEVQLARRNMQIHLAESLTAHTSLLTTQTQMLRGRSAQEHLVEHLLSHLSLLALLNQQLTRRTIQLECKVQKIESEKQAQAIFNEELQKCFEASQREIEVLKLKESKDVGVQQEVSGRRKQQEVDLQASQHKQKYEREKQVQATESQKCSEASKREIEVPKVKASKKDVQREATGRRKHNLEASELRIQCQEFKKERQAHAMANAESQEKCKREIEALKWKVKNKASKEVVERRQQKENLEESLRRIQALEDEKQTQATVNAELRKYSDANKCEIEALKLGVEQKSERQQKECLIIQRKVQELEREKVTSQHEIEDLKLDVNRGVKQEVAKLRKQLDEDRASLTTLQRCINLLPPVNLMMTNFGKMKNRKEDWYSPPFYTHPQGYKMYLNVVANGIGDGKGTHVSMFACLMRGEFDQYLKWPFQGSVVIQLCNQLEDKYHCGDTIDFNKRTDPKNTIRVTSGERAEGRWGTHALVAHSDLNSNPANNCQYLKDDCLHFRIITVESLSEPGVLPTERTMTNFEQHKADGDHWLSQPFYTHPQGYKMCLDVYADGYGDGKGTHVSVGVCLMGGEYDGGLKWPFQGNVTIAMLNQLEDSNHTTEIIRFTDITNQEAITRVTGMKRAPRGSGHHTFITHAALKYKPAKNCQYLKNDCLRFRVVNVELK